MLLAQALARQQQVGRDARLARGDVHHLAQIHPAQDILDAGRGITGRLLEDQHLGMVVNREGLFRELVIELPAAQVGVGLEYLDQLKPKLALEHARLGDAVTPDDGLGPPGSPAGSGNIRW